MTATGPVFDPARSAALRDILHETVATAPTRAPRTRFAILGGLIGAAVLLAGGTAALALTGALHFGAPAPAPVPTTPTPSVTPTPTPTPTATAPRTIGVQTSPITLHDVDEPNGSPWTLDLPGTGRACEQRHVYDIADGLALFQFGAHVVGDGSPDCVDEQQHISLSLVDTREGRVLWTREWSWQAPPLADVDVYVLGTSGRILVRDQVLSGGPHEVIDLASGSTVGDFTGGTPGNFFSATIVSGPSGDIVMAEDGRVVRVDPRDTGAPRWATPVDGQVRGLNIQTAANGFVPITYTPTAPNPDGSSYSTARLDLETGRLDSGWDATSIVTTASTNVLLPPYVAGADAILTGLSSSGTPTWTATHPGSEVRVVDAIGSTPGRSSGSTMKTDLLAQYSTTEMSLIDAATGESRWTTDISRCAVTRAQWGSVPVQQVVLDSSADRLIIVIAGEDGTGARTCGLRASSGEPAPLPDVPASGGLMFGPSHTYALSPWPATGIRAFDRRTGAELWQDSPEATGQWLFAGGYLVHLENDRVSGIG